MNREYLWALLTLVAAIALAFVLLTVAKEDNNSQGAAVQQLPPLPRCIDKDTRGQIERLTNRAVDQGYQRHVSHLFDVLMGNPNTEQFNRARTGMQNGIKGYLLAQEHVNAWTPAVCDAPL